MNKNSKCYCSKCTKRHNYKAKFNDNGQEGQPCYQNFSGNPYNCDANQGRCWVADSNGTCCYDISVCSNPDNPSIQSGNNNYSTIPWANCTSWKSCLT